jgi:hypothetical protein
MRLVTPGMSAFCRIATSERMMSGRTKSTRTTMPPRITALSLSAAWRSTDSMIETSRPMKSGITVSISATARLVTNITPNQRFVCLTKCQ